MECTKERQQWEKNNHKAKNIGTYNWNLNAVIVIIPTERLQLTQEHQLPPNHPTSLSAPRSKWGKSTVWKYYRKNILCKDIFLLSIHKRVWRKQSSPSDYNRRGIILIPTHKQTLPAPVVQGGGYRGWLRQDVGVMVVVICCWSYSFASLDWQSSFFMYANCMNLCATQLPQLLPTNQATNRPTHLRLYLRKSGAEGMLCYIVGSLMVKSTHVLVWKEIYNAWTQGGGNFVEFNIFTDELLLDTESRMWDVSEWMGGWVYESILGIRWEYVDPLQFNKRIWKFIFERLCRNLQRQVGISWLFILTECLYSSISTIIC